MKVEVKLDRHTFVRISNSEIINLKKVTALDLTLSEIGRASCRERV